MSNANTIGTAQPPAAFDQDSATYELSAPYKKWGSALNAGFQLLPDVLLKHQHRLDLGANDLVVLINLMMSWWYPERFPFPRVTTIARRMGVGARTVQRSLQRLEERGLMTRVTTHSANASTGVAYDLTGLVARLQFLAEGDTAYRKRFPPTVSGELEELH